jgi:mRNA interferase RelE/StbE
MLYDVKYTHSAIKDLMKLPSDAQDRIREAIEELRENPRHRGVEKLTDSKIQEYRIRVGKYRIKFLIQDEILLIFVIKIGLRKNVYDN